MGFMGTDRIGIDEKSNETFKITITEAVKEPSSKCWSYSPEELDYLFEMARDESRDLNFQFFKGRLYELEETEQGI